MLLVDILSITSVSARHYIWFKLINQFKMMNCSFQNPSSSPSKNILMQDRNPTRRICRCRQTNASDGCASLRLQTHETQGKAERCHAAQRSALVGACGPTIFWLASCPKIPSRPNHQTTNEVLQMQMKPHSTCLWKKEA